MKTEDAIRARRTLKLRVDPQHPLPLTKGEDFKKQIQAMIELAGQAPFHHQSHEHYHSKGLLKGVEPWRFHALDGESCRKLLASLNEDKPVKCSDGIKEMLAAADALIMVSWLPERTPRLKKGSFYPNVKNMEHIAATGAAIQNLLLAATAKGITNYWSSGGCLRKPAILETLGVSDEELLLGAVFLFPDEYNEDVVKTKTGKNRESRGHVSDWMDWLQVDSGG
ncbi:MAG: hypothetical protein FH748_05590 [Balneolaceae bacterium]|nr:hypothetical protein [Balneolaceae bacterium]